MLLVPSGLLLAVFTLIAMKTNDGGGGLDGVVDGGGGEREEEAVGGELGPSLAALRERRECCVCMRVWGPKAVESGAAESQENRTEQKASEVKRRRGGHKKKGREGKGRKEGTEEGANQTEW